MKYLKHLLIITFLSLTLSGRAAENNIIFEKANDLYHNKYYDSAAALYQQMIDDGYQHPDLYYNAGNAYYRGDKTGMAVWCFTKALQIKERKNYRDNLMLAQKKIEHPLRDESEIFFLRWWHSIRDLCSVNQWAIMTLLLFLAALLLLTIRNIFQKPILSKGFARLLLLFTAFSGIFLFARWYDVQYHYHGIIIEHNTEFAADSKSLSTTLSEGIEVEFLERRYNKLKVRLPDGRTGLISAKAFKRI